MGGKIHGGVVLDELSHAVECLAGGFLVLIDDGELVGLERGVAVGHIAVEHVVEAVHLGNDDAVAAGVSPFMKKTNADPSIVPNSGMNRPMAIVAVMTILVQINQLAAKLLKNLFSSTFCSQI
jgi:hypothetical protein